MQNKNIAGMRLLVLPFAPLCTPRLFCPLSIPALAFNPITILHELLILLAEMDRERRRAPVHYTVFPVSPKISFNVVNGETKNS